MKKICIIGCGASGLSHLENIMRYEGEAEVCGFCDLIIERAEDFVEKAGRGRAYTNYIEMYDEISPDMVFICVPPYCHGELEFETIRRGIHFFTEKPIALDIRTAEMICSSAEEKGIITAVGFVDRYSYLMDHAADFCRENEIVSITCTDIRGIDGAFWQRDRELSGGQLMESTLTLLDALRCISGEPDTVCTYAARGFVKGVTDYNTDDCTVTIVKFANGSVGTITSGCYVEDERCRESKIVFSSKDKRGELILPYRFEVFGEIPEVKKKSDFVVSEDGESYVYESSADGSALCGSAFINAVVSGDRGAIRCGYRDALKTLGFAMACERSLITGTPVKIEE